MDGMGRHIISELWGCDEKKLNNLELIKQLILDTVKDTKAEIRKIVFHKFDPQGISGVVIFSESHVTIHSIPEHGYASIDIYSCHDQIDPKVSTENIAEVLHAKVSEKTEFTGEHGPVLFTNKEAASI
ncbi:adenosylmethionine decarboxylase [Terrilactibacillus sp. BCM23-1]|uniref:S-adenosylmethionine decarboxylase proenzyme n=1 Tax=Terrilactibacillus tamarindi TaxID=2599694 RepID=A0A6N8CPX3_9BACI|nr:adenosylmethionine decarboxylase [Terrilactibacillus tamarindi]MTT31680.1 adenosylmethionine decarboxylase [Terrilactibacillus tamarindi]